MDTISMVLTGSRKQLKLIVEEEDSLQGIKILKNNLENKGALIIKMSYPKYHSYSNAYLVNTKAKALISQKLFIEELLSVGVDIYELNYRITRVDIPFTCYMRKNEEFNDYYRVFKYMAMIGEHMGIQSIKAFSDFLDNKVETINFKKSNDANWSLTIYNQYKKFVDKYSDNAHNDVFNNFNDLKDRIRVEVKKSIKRGKEHMLEDFIYDDVFTKHYQGHKKYLLDNYLNLDVYKDIKKNEEDILIAKLCNRESNFRWEQFISDNLDIINSYEPLKNAVDRLDLANSTKKEIITKIRKKLKNIENSKPIRIIKVQKMLIRLEEAIRSSKLE